MNIKDINAAWIEAGQKVDDLNAKITAALVDEEVSAEEIADMKAKRDDAVMRRDSLKDQLAIARENEKAAPVKDEGPAVITDTKKKENAKMGLRG